MIKKQVITRFAPSPTGDPHIGSLRNALYAWLFARANDGKFLLRIDDTDRARYQEGSDKLILEMLEWVKIDYDETWRQSKRRGDHQKYAEHLIERGHAYQCFCTSERLEKMRQKQQANKEAPRYDKTCRNLSREDSSQRQAQGDKFVVRFKIPESGQTEVKDLVRGEVIFENNELDDFVILKSDGFPTYHLASVADDNDYNVTHVIRSEEWIPSLPKHVLIYEAFGWQVPEFVHLPLILATDKSKLSKRHGATGVMQFQELGYLPEALVNFVLLLGWHPKKGSEQEVFSREEMLKQFSLDDVQKSGAIFDYQKLDWMNRYYIRNTDLDKLAKFAEPFLKPLIVNATNKVSVEAAIGLERERINKLSELTQVLQFVFEDLEYESDILIWKKSDRKTAIARLELLAELFETIKESFLSSELEKAIKTKIESEELGTGETLWPMRVALSGQKSSPGPFEIAAVLGKEETLKRLKQALEKLRTLR